MGERERGEDLLLDCHRDVPLYEGSVVVSVNRPTEHRQQGRVQRFRAPARHATERFRVTT